MFIKYSTHVVIATLSVLFLNGAIVCSFNQLRAEPNSISKEAACFRYSEADDCTCALEPCICCGRMYLSRLFNRILNHWNPPKSHNEKIVVEFKVHSNGDISNLRLISGVEDLSNNSALDAVKDSAPFYALPENISGDVDLKFEFPTKKEISIPNKSTRASTLDETFKIYLYLLQRKARNIWKASDCSLGHGIAVVSFDLNKNGKLTNCLVVKSSNSTSFDTTAIRMIEDLSPVSIAPGLENKLQCQFTFDSDLNRCFLSKVILN